MNVYSHYAHLEESHFSELHEMYAQSHRADFAQDAHK